MPITPSMLSQQLYHIKDNGKKRSAKKIPNFSVDDQKHRENTMLVSMVPSPFPVLYSETQIKNPGPIQQRFRYEKAICGGKNHK